MAKNPEKSFLVRINVEVPPEMKVENPPEVELEKSYSNRPRVKMEPTQETIEVVPDLPNFAWRPRSTEVLTYKLKEGQLGNNEAAKKITAAFNAFSDAVAKYAKDLPDEVYLDDSPEMQAFFKCLQAVIKDKTLYNYIVKKKFKVRKRFGQRKKPKQCCDLRIDTENKCLYCED